MDLELTDYRGLKGLISSFIFSQSEASPGPFGFFFAFNLVTSDQKPIKCNFVYT